jgi:hypothetical protein
LKDTVARYHVEMRDLHTTSGVERKDNGLRHSFASYHLALHEDAPKTALQIGHQSPAVLFEHYRELTAPEEALRYWNIRPRTAPANVVAFGRQEAAYA